MADLTDINGVGPARAERLEDAGFETVADIIDADEDDLEDVLTAGADVAGIKSNAADVGGDESDDTDDADRADATEKDPRAATRTFAVDDPQTARYLYKGLIDDELRLRQQNKVDDADTVVELADELLDTVGPDGGEMEVTLDELSVLYTAIRNVEQEFQQTRGITHLVGKLRDVRVEIQDLRSELWPDS